MSEATHFETAPEDRIPFIQKLVFGTGAFVNNTLAAAMGGMVIVLNLGLGMNPALVGLLGALPRITDALTDPLMGYISDNTRTRWGRRRLKRRLVHCPEARSVAWRCAGPWLRSPTCCFLTSQRIIWMRTPFAGSRIF